MRYMDTVDLWDSNTAHLVQHWTVEVAGWAMGQVWARAALAFRQD